MGKGTKKLSIREKRKLLIFGIIIIMIGLCILIMMINKRVPSIITDVGEYNKIRKEELTNNKGYDYLPNKIPKGATNVKFRYLRGFMQGKSNLSLSFNINKDYIEDIINKYMNETEVEACSENSTTFNYVSNTSTFSEFIGKEKCQVYIFKDNPKFGFAVDWNINYIGFFFDYEN